MNHQVNSVPTNAETKPGLQDANDWIPYFVASIAAFSCISPYLQDISMSLYPFFSHVFTVFSHATDRPPRGLRWAWWLPPWRPALAFIPAWTRPFLWHGWDRLGAGATGLGLALGRLEMVKHQQKHDWRTSKCWNMIGTSYTEKRNRWKI